MDDQLTPPTGPADARADGKAPQADPAEGTGPADGTGPGNETGPGNGTDPGAGSGRRRWDRSTRKAALVATLVALPVTVAVAGFTFASLAPEEPAAAPSPGPSVTAVRPQSTAPVEMAAVPLAERPTTVCRALLSQLPPTVRDLAQRPVTAGPEQNAAYGDPALTVACGVPEPTFPPTDTVWVVGKVCWYASEQPAATVLTTVDRETAVRVTVPRVYEQPLQWVTPVADAVVASIRTGGPVPAGCQS